MTETTALTLPTVAELNATAGVTCGELAAKLYPGMTYDHALPQAFWDEAKRRGCDYTGAMIWLYEPGFSIGGPAPLHAEARDWLTENYDGRGARGGGWK